MDFFYDGGKKVRDNKANVLYNLQNISSHLLCLRDSTDFAFLQEVDIDSKRSYHFNEVELLCNRISQCVKSYAINYNAAYVPIPVFKPLGCVNSGILNLSHIIPAQSARYSFNKDYDWPKNLFMLKRCFLVNIFPVKNEKELILINLHNSAYDDGKLRLDQLQVLSHFFKEEYNKGNYVVAGGDWNQYPPHFKADFNGYIQDKRNISVPDTLLPKDWIWAFDNKLPSNRDLQTSLGKNTLTQVIDFFVVSPNIEVISIKCLDYKFKNSDHNPVYIKFRLKG